MKYSSQVYAKAFLQTVAVAKTQEQSKLLSRFLAIVRKNGDYPLIKKIFKQIQEALVKSRGGRMVILELAREVSPDLMAKLKTIFSTRDHIEQIIRSDLIAGLRVLIDGEREVDFTLRKKLRILFNVA